MAKKKYKRKEKKTEVKEPVGAYAKRSIRIFNSFEEQENYELEQMAAQSPLVILQQMRAFINAAYGMHGYNPDKLPAKHFVRIVKGF